MYMLDNDASSHMIILLLHHISNNRGVYACFKINKDLLKIVVKSWVFFIIKLLQILWYAYNKSSSFQDCDFVALPHISHFI